MRAIALQVQRSMFGQTLGEIREWIDRNRADPVKFASTSDPNGYVVVRLEFPRAELGFAFRREWAQTMIEEAPAAA